MFNSFRFFMLAALFLTSVSWSADFRNNNWGDSPAEVMHYEGEVLPWMANGPYSNNKIFTEWFAYFKKHLGIESSVFFKFTPDEKLGMAFCGPDDAEVRAFYVWEEALSDLYGEPENCDEILTDDESLLEVYYRGDPRAVEEAVSKGFFALVRYWETERTYIWLAAEAPEILRSGVFLCVSYRSKEYFDLYRDEEEKGKPPPRRGLPPWYGNRNE